MPKKINTPKVTRVKAESKKLAAEESAPSVSSEKLSRRLYYGDNLEILRKNIPAESVDLCYIDPPFNSQRNYNQIYNNVGSDDKAQAQAFVDTWTWDDIAQEGLNEIQLNHGGRFPDRLVDLMDALYKVIRGNSLMAYLVHMSLRISEIHRVLKKTGSFYLHCDPTASHYLKIILDSVFDGNFRTEISWKRSSAHNDAKQGRKQPGNIRDVIFFYTKSDDWTWNWDKNYAFTPYDESYIENFYKYLDPKDGRRYRVSDLTAAKPGGDVSYDFHGTKPYKGRFWAYSKENMEQFFKEGRLHFPKSGGTPGLKNYLDKMPGVSLQNDWDDIRPVSGDEDSGYPTQKPKKLLERIIACSSNPGDVVLDAYCGCGTSVVAAEQLKRSWTGIDITYQAVSYILKRTRDEYGLDVANSVLLSGVPQDLESAKALANRKDDKTRKEFEKWSILAYSNNYATIHEKKGADGGIDGIIRFAKESKGGVIIHDKAIVSVKSGHVNVETMRDLRGTVERENAAMGILLTLEDPTGPMKDEAKAAGIYKHALMGRNYDRLRIVTVREIVENKVRFDLPMGISGLKDAKLADKAWQEELL